MMVRFVAAAALALALTVPAQAQTPVQRRQQLQGQIVEQFLANLRVQAGMTDRQFERFRTMTRDAFQERNALAQRERSVWMAMEGQMRPGIAADADSLAGLLDQLLGIQREHLETARREQAAFAEFLDPVQRAQVTLAWRRLQAQIERVRGLRGQGPPWQPGM